MRIGRLKARFYWTRYLSPRFQKYPEGWFFAWLWIDLTLERNGSSPGFGFDEGDPDDGYKER